MHHRRKLFTRGQREIAGRQSGVLDWDLLDPTLHPFTMPLLSSLTWKRSVALAGLMGLLAAAAILAYRTGITCGDYILGRWPRPYLIAAAALALLSGALIAAGLRLSEQAARSVGQRLLLVGGSIGVTLLGLDIALRLTHAPYVFPEAFYVNHDRLGYFFKPNAQHRFTLPDYRLTMFRTDAQGFVERGDSNAPDPDARRIQFLGDSFVEATQVTPDESMSVAAVRSLEASDRDWQALNTGVSGYSPIQYLLAYREFAPAFDPEIVVVVVTVGNDFYDTLKLLRENRVIAGEAGEIRALRPYLAAGDVWTDPSFGPLTAEEARATIIPEQVWRGGIFRTLQWLTVRPACDRLENDRLRADLEAQYRETRQGESEVSYDAPCDACRLWSSLGIGDDIMAIFRVEYSEEDLAAMEPAADVLRTLAAEVRADGRRLILVILPNNHQIMGQGNDIKVRMGMAADEIITTTAPQEYLLDLCQREGIPCLDLLPMLRAHDGEMLYWPNEMHMTAHGQALTGEAIAGFILSEEGR